MAGSGGVGSATPFQASESDALTGAVARAKRGG